MMSKIARMVGLVMTLSGLVLTAAPLEFTEEIIDLSADKADSIAGYETICEQWKEDLNTQYGSKLLYASCGGPETKSIYTYKYTYHTMMQNHHKVYYYSWDKEHLIGYDTSSSGKLLLKNDKPVKSFTETLTTGTYSCNGDCIEPKEDALDELRQKCSAFKTKAKDSFGQLFLYASCGSLKNIAKSGSNRKTVYRSTGTIYYVTE